MMKRLFTYIFLIITVLALGSCIENDLSYPRVNADIISIEVEGQKEVSIDAEKNTVEIVVGESVDLSGVKILACNLSDKAEVVGGMPDSLDLRNPVELILRVYEDEVWTISATQPVERYIRCDNQAGEADIDPKSKVAYVYVSENQSLLDVKINEMKLEPEGSKVKSTLGFISVNGQSIPKTEECHFPMVLDCVIMRYFTVEYKGQDIVWEVYFLQKAVNMEITSVNAWAYMAGVKAIAKNGSEATIEYRKESEEEWSTVSDIKVEGRSVSAWISGLDPETGYVTRLVEGQDVSEDYSFHTGGIEQLPNLDFDSWSDNDRYPNPAGINVWDSANSSGAAVTTSPSSDSVEGYAARLESVTAFGMMAAGNIFTGQFAGLAGLGAELDWGAPFSSRPIALRGYYKYSPVVIDKAKDPYTDKIGTMDECQILAFLTDWDKQFRVNTNKKQFVDLDNDPGIIALGQINSSKADSEYVKFTLPLIYRDNSRIPTYIVIAGASSRYGDYFTGGIGSVLLIDEFELIYDPAELTESEYEQVFSKVKPY